MVFSNNLLMGAAGQASGYEINQSIRFNDDDSAIMDRTPSSASNRKTWTWSGWVKRATDAEHTFFAAGDNSSNRFGLKFRSAANGGTLAVFDDISAATSLSLLSNRSMRDFSAWYHIVCAVDTTQSTASNRCKLYVNGDQVTDFSSASYMGQNTDTSINNTVTHRLGRLSYSSSHQFDGYLAEINFVDGSQLAPANFGETNTDTGQWVPIKYSGSYGTNGFYITGADSSDLGEDFSGNNNDFTSSGLTAADQVSDSPTANWCVWNPIDTSFNDNVTSDGNLVITTASPGYTRFQLGTFGVTSGKWEWKWTPTASLSDGGIGVDDGTSQAATGASSGAFSSQSANGVIYRSNGQKLVGGTASSYGASFAADDVIRVQLNLDAGTKTIEFFKNDASQGTINLNDNVTYFPAQFSADASLVTVADFGQTGFTAAAGFSLLNASNLPDPTIALPGDHMNTVLYTGNGTTGQSITGVGFQPDWVWTKIRSPNAYSHQLFDAVRGAGKNLQSNNTNAEGDLTAEFISFDSDGFTIDDDGNGNVNENSSLFASWNWKANGSGSSNSDGSITSTASANTTSGFSIVTYTGNQTSGATFGHGLGVAPKMVIVKERSPAGNNWMVGHDAMGWGKYIAWDTNAAQVTSSARWNDTAPSSTVVTLGNDTGINQNTATYVAYCFAEVEGYSSIGSYEGNGSTDGPFIYLGFKPAWIMLKRYDSSGEWEVSDRVRDPDNPVRLILQPNSNAVEWDATTRDIDWLSNGFKHLSSHADFNASGGDYLYLAFAESPFKTATAR
jgi:hypothetical protein